MGAKVNGAGKYTLPIIGLLFITLSVVSFLLQVSFLNVPCNHTSHTLLIDRESESSASALRRRDQSLAEQADQQYQQSGDSTHASDQADGTDDDGAVTGPKASSPLDQKSALRVVSAATPPSRPRVLIGIFSADFPTEQRCRHRQRKLLRTHPHACSLDKYIADRPEACQLVYTFVVGGNPDAPTTELVDGSRPWVLSHNDDNPHTYQGKDLRESDVSLLNIRENMNDGKSQTWFAYAAQLAKEHGFDYIVKQDTDTILYLDRYFEFVDNMLPPAPYNRNILAGSIVDKFWWGSDKVNRQAPAERWAIRKYGGLLHLYAEGQWYLMSPDLAETVRQQALLGEETIHYFAGHEDHDVSAMAFHSDRPINLIIVSMQQRHWLHNVKISLGNSRWNRLWDRETRRMQRYVQNKLQLDEAMAQT